MNNFLSYCGLVDAKIGDPDKDLPVCSSGLSEAKTTVCHLHHIVGDWPWRPCKGHFLYLNHYQATSQFFLLLYTLLRLKRGHRGGGGARIEAAVAL